jgi:hypothetical protein
MEDDTEAVEVTNGSVADHMSAKTTKLRPNKGITTSTSTQTVQARVEPNDEKTEAILNSIADAIRELRSEAARRSLAEEVYGFLRTRNELNYNLLPPKQVDLGWCELLLETDLYNAICADLFGFFLHRDKQSKVEIPSAPIEPDEHEVMIHYRHLPSSTFGITPSYTRVLPSGTSALDYLPKIEMAFDHNLGDVSRHKILAEEVLGFLKLKVTLGDVQPVYRISPSATVDLGWHALITQSKAYAEISEALGCVGHPVHHSMYQDNDNNGRETRLKNSYAALHSSLSPSQRAEASLDPEMADWVGYTVPKSFRLMLEPPGFSTLRSN